VLIFCPRPQSGPRPTGAAPGQLQCKQYGSGKEQLQRRKWAEEVGKMPQQTRAVVFGFYNATQLQQEGNRI